MTTLNHHQILREYKNFPVGQTIINTDEPSDVTYVLVTGRVNIQMDGVLLDIVEPGEFLTTQMLPNAPGIVAIAKTNVRLVSVN